MPSSIGGAPDERIRGEIVQFLPRLRRFCIAIGGGVDAGEDLMQATVERALARSDQWREGTRLDSWMYRIAQNINIDQARSRRTRGVAVDLDAIAERAGEDGRVTVEQRSELEAAVEAMAELSEEQRALIALIVVDGRSYREAAETLDMPIGSVMSRLARARQAIDARLNGGERRRRLS
ncbi:MAG TPA: RNA polymerase sigma factor [Allosphingosinicella sp.]|jgi:RNA polymerase sigma-70 factor (ECF subfamily)